MECSQGRFDEAEPLYRRSVEIREASLGADHPLLAESLSKLGRLLNSQVRYNETGLIPSHHTSRGVDDRIFQGKLLDADIIYRQALQIRERSLGPAHPDVASSINQLAELLKSQGKYDEAEPLFVRALEIREKVLGMNHSEVATTLNNLAELQELLVSSVVNISAVRSEIRIFVVYLPTSCDFF